MKFLLAFLILSVIVLVHEFGHFIIAKVSGVTVTEFSLGMGPRLLKYTRKGTMYSFKLFPFGGSCRMLGEDEDSDGEGSFNSVSVWKRIAIVAAGPIFNFILAFVLSVIIIGKMGYDPCEVYSVEKGSAAEEAGLLPGDKIVKVNNTKVTFYEDYFLYTLDHSNSEAMKITYERDGKRHTTTVYPKEVTKYQMGITISNTKAGEKVEIAGFVEDSPAKEAGLEKGDRIVSINGEEVADYDALGPILNKYGSSEITVSAIRDNGELITAKLTPVEAKYYTSGLSMSLDSWTKVSPIKTVGYSFKYTGYWIKAVFKSFKLLFTGKASVNDVSGPVGIVSVVGDVVSESSSSGALYVFLNLINFSVMISANLGIMNLLPIPALDGGRLVFLFIEAIRKKPVPRDKEGMVHFVGIVLLMILMVAVMFNDIRKLF